MNHDNDKNHNHSDHRPQTAADVTHLLPSTSTEKRWIESESNGRQHKKMNHTDEDDDAEDDAVDGLDGLFADPDPYQEFEYQWGSSIRLQLSGYKAELGQTLHSTGLTAWKAAEILAHYLLANATSLQKQQTILELGAGIGVCGILASKIVEAADGPSSTVIMTDGDTQVLANLRRNIQRNHSTAMARQLIWGDIEQIEAIRSILGSTTQQQQQQHYYYDLILGSDIIYVEEAVEPLFRTVKSLLNKETGEFWMAFARRNVSIDYVLSIASAQGFEYQYHQQHPTNEGVYIFRIDTSKIK
jgi:predicted nicotinamide N-methyase